MWSILLVLACTPKSSPTDEVAEAPAAEPDAAPAAAEADVPVVAEATAADEGGDVETVEAPVGDAADAPAVPTAELATSWTSPSCGERKYARDISFAEGGTYSGTDLVSPCPPKARCVWSGVVGFTGKYTVAGTTVALAEDTAESGPGTIARPATLSWDGAPVETSGGERCVYTQGSAPRFAVPKAP